MAKDPGASLLESASQVRVFMSFDLNHDQDLKERLIRESLIPGSGFEILARSEALGSEGLRGRIVASDEVIVICGERTEGCLQMSAELRVAQEENKPYFLLWGRREVMCTRPLGARSRDPMYSWTWSILQEQIAATLRNAQLQAPKVHSVSGSEEPGACRVHGLTGAREMLRERCANDNHGRAVVTVRFCPNCGDLVNEKVLARGCAAEKHARMRRDRNAYCVDCGRGLAQARSGR